MRVLITDHHLPVQRCRTRNASSIPISPGAVSEQTPRGVGVMFYLLLALRAELRKRGAFDSGPTLQPPRPGGPGYRG